MKKLALFLCVLGLSAPMAFAGNANKMVSSMKMPVMTVEQRQKMADGHEKMAVCLRSERPLSECHDEMMKACNEGMGKNGCMMGGMMENGVHHQHGE